MCSSTHIFLRERELWSDIWICSLKQLYTANMVRSLLFCIHELPFEPFPEWDNKYITLRTDPVKYSVISQCLHKCSQRLKESECLVGYLGEISIPKISFNWWPIKQRDFTARTLFLEACQSLPAIFEALCLLTAWHLDSALQLLSRGPSLCEVKQSATATKFWWQIGGFAELKNLCGFAELRTIIWILNAFASQEFNANIVTPLVRHNWIRWNLKRSTST